MKASNFHYKNTLMWLLILTVSVFVFGCSDDDPTETTGSEDLSIVTIILSPKSAEPGDTVQATAVLAGYADAFPAVSWQATGGTFLETNKTTVGWVAPTTSGVFRLSCTATGASATASSQADVFVGQLVLALGFAAGEMQLRPTPPNFYYLNSPGPDFNGSDVYIWPGRTPVAPVPVFPNESIAEGRQYRFSSGLSYSAHSAVVDADPGNLADPINVYLVDMVGRSRTAVTSDGSLSGVTRHHQYQYPEFSQDNTMLAYQGLLPNPTLGEVDTIDVFVRYLSSGTNVNITRADTASVQRRNLFPSFSSDNNWAVFVSDRNAFNVWEFYGLPINGGVVDTLAASTVQLTDDGGLAGLGLVESLAEPRMTWNPNPATPTLALVGADGLLHLVTTNMSGAETRTINAFSGTINEIRWSADGQFLAVSVMAVAVPGGPTVNTIYRVTTGGAATLLHAALVGDRIYDMVWSPNNDVMVYRVTRAGKAWFELLDVGGSTDLLGPVVITAAVSDGARSTYRAEMDTGVRYDAINQVYMLSFDFSTPRIHYLDISGVLP